MTIQLHQLRFFCHHGLFKEEQLTGGMFIVNIDIEITDPVAESIRIDNTVNYVDIYKLVKHRMMQPTPLLEILVMDIANEILAFSMLIQKVTAAITKEAAPIVNFEGRVGVVYSKQRG